MATVMDFARAEIQKLDENQPELRRVFAYLVKTGHYAIPGFDPPVLSKLFVPSRPLLGFLERLEREDRRQIVCEMCRLLGYQDPV